MQINFGEATNLIIILLAFTIFIAFAIWLLVDTYLMTRFEGKVKRGIKIWSKELAENTWKYLFSIKQDIVEEKKTLFSTYKSKFIRIQDEEIIIYSSPEKYHSTWACVGYVDLKSPTREIQYRMSFPGLIFLLPFTIFGILFFVLSFFPYKASIDSFLERKTSESKL